MHIKLRRDQVKKTCVSRPAGAEWNSRTGKDFASINVKVIKNARHLIVAASSRGSRDIKFCTFACRTGGRKDTAVIE